VKKLFLLQDLNAIIVIGDRQRVSLSSREQPKPATILSNSAKRHEQIKYGLKKHQ